MVAKNKITDNVNDRSVQSMGLVFWVQCKELGEFKTKPIETTEIQTTIFFLKKKLLSAGITGMYQLWLTFVCFYNKQTNKQTNIPIPVLAVASERAV